MSLSPLDRIGKIWITTFILRIWKESIARDKFQNNENFITSFSYTCIEINAHSLVTLVLYMKARNLDHLFHPHLISSQPCEAFFREFRSMSTISSTITNSSVLGMMQRCEKIALMNEISRVQLKNFAFNTDSQRSRDIYYHTNASGYSETALPSREQIIQEIELAKEHAKKYAAHLGVSIEPPYDYQCEIETAPKKDVKQYNRVTLPRKDGTKLTQFKAIHLVDYSDKINVTKVDEKSSYVAIDDVKLDGTGQRRIYVRKSSLIALYMNHCTKLSSDRLRRVTKRAPRIDFNDRSALLQFMEQTFEEQSDESDDESWYPSGEEMDESTDDSFNESFEDDSLTQLSEESTEIDLSTLFQNKN